MMRCDCAVAGHGSYIHIDPAPPSDPWWAEWVDLYDQITEFFRAGRDSLEKVAEWLRKVYISVRNALVSLAERISDVLGPRAEPGEPMVRMPAVGLVATPHAVPRSSTLRTVKLDVRAPPRPR